MTNIEKFAYYLNLIDYTPHKFRMNITLMIREINEQLASIHTEEIPNLIVISGVEPMFHVISEEISNRIRVLEKVRDTLEELITE